MKTETRLIQSGALQIMPVHAQSVRRGAETTRSFAELLDTRSAPESKPEPTERESALIEERPAEDPDGQPVDSDSGTPVERVSDQQSEASKGHGSQTDSSDQVEAEEAADENPEPPTDSDDGEPRPVIDHRPVSAETSTEPQAAVVSVSDESAESGRPAQEVGLPEQTRAPAEQKASVEDTTRAAEPVKPDVFVRLSRRGEAARERVQSVQPPVDPSKTDVARAASEQLELATPRQEISDRAVVVDSGEPDDSIGAFRDQLRRQVLAGSTKQEPEPAPQTAASPQTREGRQSPEADQNPKPEAPPAVAQNTTPSGAIPAAILGSPAVPEAIRSVLDRIQGVRSMLPGVSSAPGSGASASPGSVTAIGSASGASIGSDAGASGKLGVIRGQSSSTDRGAVIAQVQRGLASVLRSGGGDMTIRLRPDHLGELKIRVHAENGAVRATFETKTEGAREAIEHGLGRLREQLEAKGVRVDELRVDHRGENASGTGGQSQSDRGDEQQHEPRQSSHQHTPRSGSDTLGHNETQNEEQRGIWTELGLDAVA